jgi:hypothetical protein
MIYDKILSEEKSFKAEQAIDLKSNRLELVEYIFVTFKNNESRDKAADVFIKEPKVHKCFRKMCCLSDK